MKNLDLLIPKPHVETDRFLWGTITQASPVRIRLDGEDAALEVTPDCLVDPESLTVGQRAWCQLNGRRLLILGKTGRGVPDSGWIAPTLQNGWVNWGWWRTDAGYRLIGDVVHLRGFVKSGTANATIFTLPVGYRPVLEHALTGVAGRHTSPYMEEKPIRVDVARDGQVWTTGAGTDWISLDGISFLRN